MSHYFRPYCRFNFILDYFGSVLPSISLFSSSLSLWCTILLFNFSSDHVSILHCLINSPASLCRPNTSPLSFVAPPHLFFWGAMCSLSSRDKPCLHSQLPEAHIPPRQGRIDESPPSKSVFTISVVISCSHVSLGLSLLRFPSTQPLNDTDQTLFGSPNHVAKPL